MKKYYIILILLFCCSDSWAGICEGEYVSQYSDISKNYEYCSDVRFTSSMGWARGYSDRTFRPKKEITRAEFMKIVLIASRGLDHFSSEVNDCFSDVKNTDWFHSYVCVAKNESIVNGYSDNKFNPHENISYIQALKIVLEAFKFERPIGVFRNWWDIYMLEASRSNYYIKSDINQKITREEAVRIIRQVYEKNVLKVFKDKNVTLKSSGYSNALVISFNSGFSEELRGNDDIRKYMMIAITSYFYMEDYILDGFSETLINGAVEDVLTRGKMQGLDILETVFKSVFVDRKIGSTKGSLSIALLKENGYLNGDVYIAGGDGIYEFAGVFDALNEEKVNPCGCTLGKTHFDFSRNRKVPNCYSDGLLGIGWGGCMGEECGFEYCE
ncbi:MAG: S-layer homology domain-containing protein [Candidatus Thiothrix sulfatifontis]|nr:MAG: S-layer homology domain-containing protein [Candidatus Thiothrix sulfatifontis]